MKTIGIIGAMEEEVALLKEKMEVVSAKNIVGADVYLGKMCGKSVVIARCGIGKVNAAVCAQVLIDLYGVDYIINIGVAGALSDELNIGDIVISDDLIHHDMDSTAFGYPAGTIPRMKESHFLADDELVGLAQKAGEEVIKDNRIFVERIVSGDQFISDSSKKSHIHNAFKAYCVEMEGAAIGHACYLNKIPFVVIRAISDKAGDGSHVDFNSFMKKAAENSSNLVEKMLLSM